jgi:hypothetical protein
LAPAQPGDVALGAATYPDDVDADARQDVLGYDHLNE